LHRFRSTSALRSSNAALEGPSAAQLDDLPLVATGGSCPGPVRGGDALRRRCAGLLGLLMLAIILPAQVHAESVTLDFETLPAGGEPPFGLLLRDQYAPTITFVPGVGGGGGADGGAMITHCSPTPGSQTLCTSARSGKSVIVGVPDRSDEFLIHPIAMEFGQPQRVVSMYLRYPLPADRTQV